MGRIAFNTLYLEALHKLKIGALKPQAASQKHPAYLDPQPFIVVPSYLLMRNIRAL